MKELREAIEKAKDVHETWTIHGHGFLPPSMLKLITDAAEKWAEFLERNIMIEQRRLEEWIGLELYDNVVERPMDVDVLRNTEQVLIRSSHGQLYRITLVPVEEDDAPGQQPQEVEDPE